MPAGEDVLHVREAFAGIGHLVKFLFCG